VEPEETFDVSVVQRQLSEWSSLTWPVLTEDYSASADIGAPRHQRPQSAGQRS